MINQNDIKLIIRLIMKRFFFSFSCWFYSFRILKIFNKILHLILGKVYFNYFVFVK